MNSIEVNGWQKDCGISAIVKATFPSYRRKKIYIRASESVTFTDLNWSGGTRSEYRACTLTGHGLGSMDKYHQYAPWDPRQVEGQSVAIPAGSVVVRGGYFCGKESTLCIMLIRLRPTHTSCGTYAIYTVYSQSIRAYIRGVGRSCPVGRTTMILELDRRERHEICDAINGKLQRMARDYAASCDAGQPNTVLLHSHGQLQRLRDKVLTGKSYEEQDADASDAAEESERAGLALMSGEG